MKNPINEYRINIAEQSLFIQHIPSRSIAESSLLDTDLFDRYIDQSKCNPGFKLAFFNRLFSRDRNKGIGRDLVELLLKECDKNNIVMICEVNAYGDLKQNQLREFYKRHGFVETFEYCSNGLIYYPKAKHE